MVERNNAYALAPDSSCNLAALKDAIELEAAILIDRRKCIQV